MPAAVAEASRRPGRLRVASRRAGDFAILQLPIHEKAADAWAMLWAIDHGKRVVNRPRRIRLGRTGKASSGQRSSAIPIGSPSAIRAIYPVRYVVVHRDLGLGRIWQPARELLHEGRATGAGVRPGVRAG